MPHHRRPCGGSRARPFAASALSVVGAIALTLALLGTRVGPALAQDDDEPAPISVELVGSGVPSTVEGQVLELRKITFQPGAVLPAHSHPGALVLTVVEGELAYTLFEGEASIQRAGENGEPGPVEPLVIGEEAILEVGDSLFEENVVHQARNPSEDEETVIWVSSLLQEGEDFVRLTEEEGGEVDEGDEDEGGEGDETAIGNVVEVVLTEFDILMPTELPAGETTFEISNEGSVAHGFTILGDDVEATTDDLILPGDSATLTVDLPAGEYEIICPVANHPDLGMTLEITVVDDGAGENGSEDGDDQEQTDGKNQVDGRDEGDEGGEGADESGDGADEDETGEEPTEIAVAITDFAFDPASLEVAPGTTVTWTNNDSAPHTVTSDDGAFDSGRMAEGDTFSFTFEVEGTFAYHCDIHPDMTASIEVVSAERGQDEGVAEDGQEAEDDGEDGDDSAEGEGTDGAEDEAAEPEEIAIEIVDFAFAPAEIEIAPGTTVTWTNSDSAPHTATADDGSFDSGRLEQGDSFSFTFEDAGTFAYHCEIHPNMTATVVVADAGNGEDDEEKTLEIDIADFAFDPAEVEIEVGTTVTWTNRDSAPHTVTSDDGAFDSGRLDQGDTFSFTFEEEGTFAYHCDFHPNMTATLNVVAAAEDDGAGGDDGEPASGGVDVAIEGFTFAPEVVEITPGTTVTWTNNDAAPHTVTSDDGSFDSGSIEPGQSFTFTFEEAGSFAYHCDLHPRMTGTIEVVE